MRWNAAVLNIALFLGATVVCPPLARGQTQAQNAAARNLFLEGRNLWDDGRFVDAERKFQDALKRYPRADQSDRTAFYHITTLIKLGKTADALTEIGAFNSRYPRSTWMSDVEEKRISLAGNPVFVGANTIRIAPIVTSHQMPSIQLSRGVTRLAGPHVDLNFGKAIVVNSPGLAGNASLKSEILWLILEKNPDRGIELAQENLKTNPSDPAVISNLGAIAGSRSEQALPFLVKVAATATSPNARSQAIFWVVRRDGSKETLAENLMTMLADHPDRQTATVVAEALAQLDTVDRRQAIEKFVEVKTPEPLMMFERIYRNSPSPQLRTQMTQAAARIPHASAVTFLSEVALNDKDLTVRRSAIQALAGRKDVDTVKELEGILRSLPSSEK